jgi:hypothetical protein
MVRGWMLITSAWLFGLYMTGLTFYFNSGQRFIFMNRVRHHVPGGETRAGTSF